MCSCETFRDQHFARIQKEKKKDPSVHSPNDRLHYNLSTSIIIQYKFTLSIFEYIICTHPFLLSVKDVSPKFLVLFRLT